MRTKTDRALADAEEAHMHDPERAEVIARVRRFKAGWYELAQSLTELRHGERWKLWGYPTFEDYCKRELHLKMDTVAKLTGSYVFLRNKAPEALRRDGSDAPIPTYQAVEFWRRAEEESDADEDTVREIRAKVLDEGLTAPKLSRIYRSQLFPDEAAEAAGKQKNGLKQAIDKVIELLAIAREQGSVPRALAAEVEEPLSRLAAHLDRERLRAV
jgi:hypothetical protein